MQKKITYDAVLFDLDDTLFNSHLMSETARKNALRAIREAGVELNEEEAYETLLKIVEKFGSNYGEHFDRLIEELGYETHPKLIAAAVVAYHTTKLSLLRPFPGVVLTLLTLMKKMKIGLISDGVKIKQWEKLTYLGIQHFFDVVVINESSTEWKPASYGFKTALEKLKLDNPKKVIYIGDRIYTDIVGANRMNLVSVLFDPRGKHEMSKLTNEEKPMYIIRRFSEIIDIVGLKPIKWRF